MRERWACPDLGIKADPGTYLPVEGCTYEFDDCPAYYLRTASMGLPAEHLIDGHIHPANLVGEWAFEVRNGSRNVDTLSARARDLVHLYLSEETKRDRARGAKPTKGAA